MSKSGVKRSWALTITWIVAFFVCAAIAVAAGSWAYTVEGWADFVGWPVAVLASLGALVSGVGIFTASARASCPSCGAGISAFDPAQPMVVCESCHEHAQVHEGALHALAPDYVHPSPIFSVALGPGVKWTGCVACGATATRTKTLEIKETQLVKNVAVSAAGLTLAGVAGAGFVQTGGGKVWRVPVPYCDAHEEGAILDTDFGTPVIRFRSYPVYRAIRAASSLAPSPPATTS